MLGENLHLVQIFVCVLAAGWLTFASGAAKAARPPRPLNNLVAELLEAPQVDAGGMQFTNPREGWVFFRCRARKEHGGTIRLCLDGTAADNEVIRLVRDGAPAMEAMRCLAKGDHVVHVVDADGKPADAAITVRAIPEIIYANYPANPHLKEFGTYDWAYLQRIGMLDNVNVIIGAPQGDHVDKWIAQGKRLIQQCPAPGLRGAAPAVEDVRKTWADAGGMKHPNFSGIIVDEFFPSASDKYPIWVEAFQQVAKGRPDRWIYPYIAGDPDGLLPFVKPLAGLERCRFAYERYLKEQPTEAKAKEHIEKRLRDDLLAFAREVPGMPERTVFVLGLLCGPPETLNSDPAVSYKVYMDMQFHLLANDPAVKGLYGIEEYLASYSDEEYLRWAAKLYRHYCIEGKTGRLTDDPYMLTHIRNPDFEDGLEGWTVEAAEADSVATRTLDGLGWLQGRWPQDPKGDRFLWMRRSAEKPNVVWQPVKDLQPGRAYSLRMYVSDYLELTRKQRHPISVRIDGVEMMADKGYQAVFANCYDHHIPQYGEKNTYFNLVRLFFRAKAETATLTISDWASQKDAGGPAGQELMFNFVEIEPYLEE